MANLIINIIIINIWLVLYSLQSTFVHIISSDPQEKKKTKHKVGIIIILTLRMKKQMKLIYIHMCLNI